MDPDVLRLLHRRSIFTLCNLATFYNQQSPWDPLRRSLWFALTAGPVIFTLSLALNITIHNVAWLTLASWYHIRGPNLHSGSQENSLKLTFGCALIGTLSVERITPCGRESSDLLTLMHKAPKTHVCFTAPCRDLYFYAAQRRDVASPRSKKVT